MRKAPRLILGLLCLCVPLCGCDFNLDPDSLVRDLRVLGGRMGDAAPGSVADLQLEKDSLPLKVLVAAPTGPGRRVPAPRPVTVDVYLCLTPQSLLIPGAVDPACASLTTRPAGLSPGTCPPDIAATQCAADSDCPQGGTCQGGTCQGSPLMALLYDQDPSQGMSIPQGGMFTCLLKKFGPQVLGMGGGGLPPAANGAITVQLPLVIRARAGGSDDPLDSETAFLFGRLVFSPAGMAPPPNHNPVLQPVQYAPTQDGPATPLTPCPATGPCAGLPISRAQDVWLTGLAADGSAEPYTDDAGNAQTEQLRFSWFSTDGQFDQTRTGQMLPQTHWTNPDPYAAPPQVKTVDLWVVLQDGRGGAAWDHYALSLTD